jgi:hypothetical protein
MPAHVKDRFSPRELLRRSAAPTVIRADTEAERCYRNLVKSARRLNIGAPENVLIAEQKHSSIEKHEKSAAAIGEQKSNLVPLRVRESAHLSLHF